ncbi:hypothetical protein [Nonomuraea typhae]|uniref:hypothetical protein n=1 Tax=Nonomuraea typhae TaxID=2603600 RepID=UPI0012FCA7DE|nr:hypothetical protein [Nonomuraea typhae]
MTRILLAAGALVALAGCGTQATVAGVASVASAKPSSSASPSPTGSVDPQEQGRKFAQCMRDNGIDLPDPEPGEGKGMMVLNPKDVNKAQFKKAAEACKQYRPFRDRADMKPEDLERLRDYAACMRENGVDMPDPDPGGGFGGKRPDVKPDDPAFKKAVEACRAKFPQLGVRK